MKKYIFTENQIKKVITDVINEQTSTKGKCVESLFKDSIVDNPKVKNIINTKSFQVTDIIGSVNLNGKPYNQSSLKNRVIITPQTTINICVGSSMVLSGGGLSQAGIVHDVNGVKFIPQVS